MDAVFNETGMIFKREVKIDGDDCIITAKLYEDQFVSVEIEDQTTGENFSFRESYGNIEEFTNKCKSPMSGFQFYDLVISALKNPQSQTHRCQYRKTDNDFILTVFSMTPLKKFMIGKFDLLLTKVNNTVFKTKVRHSLWEPVGVA